MNLEQRVDETKRTCPRRRHHYHDDETPDGYIERQEWFRRMDKTHQQLRCCSCGLWVVWVPKPRCVKCNKPIVRVQLHMRRWHPEVKP